MQNVSIENSIVSGSCTLSGKNGRGGTVRCYGTITVNSCGTCSFGDVKITSTSIFPVSGKLDYEDDGTAFFTSSATGKITKEIKDDKGNRVIFASN